jgi:hypothetical protein
VIEGGSAARLDGRFGAVGVRAVLVESAIVVAFLAVILVAFGYRLANVIVSDMDEGTYLLAGKLVAAGAVPYRDFMLTHPPAIAYLLGAWVSIAGAAVMPARVAYSVLVLASTVPLYVITRSLTRSQAGGLFAVASYAAGMLLLANMGRTIRLEPLMNVALIAGVAIYLWAGASSRWTILAGAILGAAVLVKIVALVPIALLVGADVLWRRDRIVARWVRLAIGFGAVLVPAGLVLAAQPRFVEDVIGAQIDRPGLPVATRIGYVVQDFVRDPLIPFGLAVSCWFVVRARDARLRAISLIGVLSTIGLVVAFRTFFGYYLVQVLPWLSVAAAAGLVQAARQLSPRISRAWSTRAIAAAALALAIVVPIGYAEAYYRTAHDHVSSPAQIVDALGPASGPLYSMYPSFALWTGLQACGDYYVADSLIARVTGRMRDDDFVSLFSRCRSLVLWTGELDEYPKTAAYVAANFDARVTNQDYALWTRKPSP